jgi:hypothetical protein
MKAAANVLGKNFNITDHTYDFRGFASRSYPGLFQAAQECGMSRLYGGIHYLESVNIGLSLAGDFGDRVGKIQLLNNFGGK